MIQVATPSDIEKIVEDKIKPVEQRLLKAIEQIGQPKYMSRDECAEEWGVTPETVSNRLRKLQQKGLITDIHWGSRVRVNRKQFFEHYTEY